MNERSERIIGTEPFAGKHAVVTGGGSGMGRELVRQLASEGCSVATCDLFLERAAETAATALADAPDGVVVTAHHCDVADAAAMDRFAGEYVEQHGVDHVDLVINNAGIACGGSFVEALTDDGARESWDRTFGVCWGGVLNGTRTFLPLLIRSPRGHLVNLSSINGVYASLGPGIAHTAYSAAKFAVRGFSEALIEDLRVNAPHVSVSVVMPGHIGTDIVTNSWRVHGEDLDRWRSGLTQRGIDTAAMDDDEVRATMAVVGDMFRDNAPLSAAGAAEIILDAVRDGRWRILVGADAREVDETVRADPEGVYAPGRSLFQILAD